MVLLGDAHAAHGRRGVAAAASRCGLSRAAAATRCRRHSSPGARWGPAGHGAAVAGLKRGDAATVLGVSGCLHGCLQLCEDCKALEVGAAPVHLHPGPRRCGQLGALFFGRLGEKQKLERTAGLKIGLNWGGRGLLLSTYFSLAGGACGSTGVDHTTQTDTHALMHTPIFITVCFPLGKAPVVLGVTVQG